MHAPNFDEMAGSTFVDLTDEKPPKRDFIDLTASCEEELNNSAMDKTNQPKANLSNDLSTLDNPPEAKVNSTAKARFAFKSSSAKGQPPVPKPGLAPKIDKDQPNANGTHQGPKVESIKSLAESLKAQPILQACDPDHPLRDDKKTQVPETPPKVTAPNPVIPESSSSIENPNSKFQELVDNGNNLEMPSNFEEVQYDVQSLEVSLEAYKTSLQTVLALVHNKHQTHVQVNFSSSCTTRRFLG